MAEILASLDDIQANLDGNVTRATDENTELLQISAARIIRGNLSNAIDNVVLQSWRTPELTPELIREAAGKFIAAQYYFNEISKSTGVIEPDSFAQKRYDEALAILTGIISGSLQIIDVEVLVDDRMSALDFWPDSSVTKPFTMGMNL